MLDSAAEAHKNLAATVTEKLGAAYCNISEAVKIKIKLSQHLHGNSHCIM